MITNVAENYLNSIWGYLKICMTIRWHTSGPHDCWAKVKWCFSCTCKIKSYWIPQMNVTYLLWRRNTNVLPWVSRWHWPNTSKVLRGLTGVLGFCDGISCPSGNISISFKKCIWKAQGLINSCSPVTQHRGGDKHKGSFGGASRWEQPLQNRSARWPCL